MIPALSARGFGHGSGLIDPAGQRFIINIPKNATSYLHDWAKHHGWRTTMIQNETSLREIIVVLRDPVDRWISGVAQYLTTYILNVYGFNGPVYPDDHITEHDQAITAERFLSHYNPAVERILFDMANRLDDHVWPQHELINTLSPDIPKRYFRIQNIDHDLATYLDWRPVMGLDRNSGRDNAAMRVLQDFFRDRIFDQRPELLPRLQKLYSQDYQLLNNLPQ